MGVDVFKYKDYKDFILAKIHENHETKGYRGILAEKCGCQKSFFSQVINSHVHFTPDHVVGLCDFWDMGEVETYYLLDLVNLARAGTAQLKDVIKKRLRKLKAKQGNPSEQFLWPKVSSSKGEHIYYSSWYWSAVHVLVSISSYESPLKISQRLNLPLALVEEALDWLEKEKLSKKKAIGWEVTQKFIHLPNSSYMNESHHTNWRQKAVNNLQQKDLKALHYSSVFTLSRSDLYLLKEMIVKHIAELHETIAPSNPEELVAFNCDLFTV